MINIEFYHKQEITKIPAELSDIFQKIINIYIQKTSLDPINTFFISNGKQVNPEQTIESQINKNNKETKNLKVMDKKKYMTPSMETIDIEVSQMLCFSDPQAPDPNAPED